MSNLMTCTYTSEVLFMIWPTHSKSHKFYAKMLMLFIITVFVTIFVLSTVLYLNFENIALQLIYKSVSTNLSQTSQSASIMTATAKSLCTQIYYDKNISKLLYNDDLSIIEMTAALSQLNSYRETSPFIDSIYIYSGRTGTFYVNSAYTKNPIISKADFYDKEIIDIIDGKHKQYTPFYPLPRRIELDESTGATSNIYTYIKYDALRKDSLDYAVVVNISETWLHKVVDGLIANSEDNTFIIDNRGVISSNSWKYPMMTNMSSTSFIQRILSSKNSSGWFTSDVDGIYSFVAYTSTDLLGWKYIRIIPYKEIVGSINDMRVNTVVIGVIILLCGVLVSFFLSKRLYQPINHMISKLKEMEVDKHNSEQKLRQEFFKNLLLGDEQFDSSSLYHSLELMGITINQDEHFILILLKIDQYQNFLNANTAEDRHLYKLEVMNIATGIFSNYSTAHIKLL